MIKSTEAQIVNASPVASKLNSELWAAWETAQKLAREAGAGTALAQAAEQMASELAVVRESLNEAMADALGRVS